MLRTLTVIGWLLALGWIIYIVPQQALAQPSLIADYHSRLANPKATIRDRANAMNRLAYEFLFVAYDSTDYFAAKSMALAKQYRLWDLVCENHTVMGYSQLYRGRHQQALKQFQLGIELAQKHSIDSSLARNFSGMGELYEDRKEYRKAYVFYTRAYGLASGKGQESLSADNHFDLFSALFNLRLYPEAEAHFSLAETGYGRAKDSISLAMLYLHRARLLTDVEKVDEAMPFLRTYLRLSKAADFNGDPAAYHLTMADALAQRGQAEEALAHGDSAIRWSHSMGEFKSVADGWLEKAWVLIKLQRWPNAKRAADSAIFYYKNNVHLEDLRLTYGVLIQLDSVLNDEADLRRHSLAYRQVAEAAFAQRTAFEDEEMKLLVLAEERQKQLYAVNSREQARQGRSQVVMVVAAALLLLCVVALLALYKNRKRLNQLQRLQTELDGRNLHLQRMNEVKNKLLSIMSHELRSPLTSLQGLLNLLHADGVTQEEFLDCIPILEAEAQNSLFLLDNLLFWVKAQMQGIHLRPAMHPLAPMVDEALQLFNNHVQKKRLNLELQVKAESTAYVDADVTRLVVRNVLNNAIKFTPEGGQILVTERAYPNGLAITIKDSGVGMPLEVVQQIQAGQVINSQRGTSHEKGAGIGLHFCLDLLQQMGGSFHVQSAIGHGTSFTLLFPSDAQAVKKLGPAD